MNSKPMRIVGLLTLCFVAWISAYAQGEKTKVKGNIISRAGSHMTLKTSDGTNVVVVLSDSTDVQQVEGVFKARRKDMAMAALIPGLECEVQGTYNAKQELSADWVRFSGEALQQAQAAQAAVHETQAQAAANAEALTAQNAALKEQQAALNKQAQEIAANKAKIAANSARFGQLDDYYILDEVTVLFANGKVNVDPKYAPALLELVQKAKTYNGYNIQVKGYASAVGSAALNQELSEERAENVTNILIQQGSVPLTAMLAPGAMGESRQVGNEKSEQGQAENRRVVVRALLNKGIAGTDLALPETKK
jgi:OmpA-OmpF porin, OOP family